jgi:hypothetical protein
MLPFAVYEAVLARAGSAAHAHRVVRLRDAFAQRTGAFSSEDPWFERRSRAFWDDALTRGGLGEALALELPDEMRATATRFSTAHRGLFDLEVSPEGVRFRDEWSGVELFVSVFDEATRAGIFRHQGGLADARLVADDAGAVYMLPGAFFHPDDATPSIEAVVDEAKRRGMSKDAALDALLLMEHRLVTLSRVKASYAYRLPPASKPDPQRP